MLWTDLNPDQQCVLLNAVEESYLFGVLIECGSAPDWAERLKHVPRLAGIVEQMVEQGLIEVTVDSDKQGQSASSVPADQIYEVISNPDSWWTPEGTKPYGLAPTDDGLAVYRSTPARDAEVK